MTFQEFLKLKNGVLFCTDVAARGLDIPGVHLILQYDPPQDPNAFVHRIGRTARIGNSGKALIFLCPEEDTYVEFLGIRKIPIKEQVLKSTDGSKDVLSELKSIVLQDRAKVDKGIRAFVSFVRAYKEHQCNFIFQFKKLDFASLAHNFAILRFPFVKDLHKLHVKFKDSDVPLESIPYLDHTREEARKKRILAERNKLQEKRKRKDPFWQAKIEAKEERQRIGKMANVKKKLALLESMDLEEIEREAKLMKKLRRGKINKKQFEVLNGERMPYEEEEQEEEAQN